MENNNLKLSTPWATYANMLAALFKYDDDILIGDICEVNNEDVQYNLDIEVYDHNKFLALWQILPRVAEFGNAKMQFSVFDLENVSGENVNYTKIFKTIFNDNPILKEICIKPDFFGMEQSYICFNPEVIQFPNDNAGDINGNWSGLAEDIARKVFANFTPNIHFCTASVEENSEKE